MKNAIVTAKCTCYLSFPFITMLIVKQKETHIQKYLAANKGRINRCLFNEIEPERRWHSIYFAILSLFHNLPACKIVVNVHLFQKYFINRI